MPPPRHPSTTRRLSSWLTAQRRPAASHFLRGLAYGAGRLACSALGFWLQHH